MTHRLHPERITDFKIHQKTKHAVLSFFRGDKRHFEVHDPFKFSDFGISELDELGPIIVKKNNACVTYQMKSLKTRYENLAMKHIELGIASLLPPSVTAIEAAPSQSSKRKRKRIELEPEIKVPCLDYNRALPEGVKFVNNWVIEQPERGLFFIDGHGDQAFQRRSDIDKAGIKSMAGFFVMAAPIQKVENQRFCYELKNKIREHPANICLSLRKQSLKPWVTPLTEESATTMNEQLNFLCLSMSYEIA